MLDAIQRKTPIIMAQVHFNKAFGIASISGRIGPLVFYNRNGKTYVRASDKNAHDVRAILEALCLENPGNVLTKS